MNELIVKLRILARAEVTLFKADADRRRNQAQLMAISIGCIFVGLVFVNTGLFFLLTDSTIDSRAAFILAGGNFALAVVPFLLRKQSKAGPSEQMVREIREMAADEISRDIGAFTDEITAVGASIKQLKSGISSFGGAGGGAMGALGPVLPLLIDQVSFRTTTVDDTPFDIDPVRLAAWSVIAVVTVTLLVVGKALLVPLAIAIFIWILLGAIKSLLVRLAPGGMHVPAWLANVIGILVIVPSAYATIAVIMGQSEALAAAVPVYQTNFAAILASLKQTLNIVELPTTESLLSRLDLAAILSWVGDSVTALMSDIMLIAIYVGFLLAEEHILPAKIRHLHKDPEKAERISQLATDVSSSIQRYVGMKTIVSLLTAIVSYAVLVVVGVDFAIIWALLVFFLNFIPTIGSIVAVVFPALLTLVQFDTITPFLIVAIGLGGTQFVIGNVIEPTYVGKSLNLSSLMILLALSFWGTVWGLPGMFLAVPLMVMTGIVCAQFRGLRWIAVILSADGNFISSKTKENKK
jgi:predicted PurR-regulated permease PerM